MRNSFPVYRQLDAMDCGPTCLRMIAKYYGKYYSLQTLRDYSYITREGVSMKGISEAAVKIGMRTLGVKLRFEQLDDEAPLPCILHWNQNHFVVLPPQGYDRNREKGKILIVDPAHGLVKVSKEVFLKSWISTGDKCGMALLLNPTPLFFDAEDEIKDKKSLTFLLRYLFPFKAYVTQLFFGMLISSVLALITPFLMQGLVDYGINQHSMKFIYLILFSQLALFIGVTAIEMIRSWILLHMSARINISIISDFLIKLMKLPIRFFDTKMVGDITQRISDHARIESFLTGTSLSTLFSMINLLVFAVVLGLYSFPILIVFLTGSTLAIGWILFFMKKRRELDYARFQRMSENQNSLYEIITGMQEIKINDSETTHRWRWERIQARLFKINIKALRLTQYQTTGSTFFTQAKNIITSFIAASAVLNGSMSLGMMLSVSYIIGQMNPLIGQLLGFLQSAQDARISLERLNEVHSREDEETGEELIPDRELEIAIEKNDESTPIHRHMLQEIPLPDHHILNGSTRSEAPGLVLKNVSFQYAGPDSPMVLDNISLTIPFGKVTAIVGASGSGKTTLMKLLLKFYDPVKGHIFLGATPLNKTSAKWWRQQCGVVMADGFIFSSTIADNIAVQEDVDQQRLLSAVKQANIESFINGLPSGFATTIGNSGTGISSGQRQRILIARAIYKNPKFLFLDEATSTLDANNERVIINNLESFFKGRTVLVIAHRLSTVKHADQIVVMKDGKIVEIGNHSNLTAKKGKYYELVKNQLELGA